MFPEKHEHLPLKPRIASKGLLWFPDGRLLLVAGKRGMLNFVGGGCKPGETFPFQRTFLREAGEEINLQLHHIRNLQQAPFDVTGRTTSTNGTELATRWIMYLGELVGFSQQPPIPEGSEITATAALTPWECFHHPNISELALDGIRKGLDAGLIPTSPRLD